MKYIPYGRQVIDEDDISAVVEVLRSDWLTTGPVVGRFEEAVCAYTGAKYGVAVANGTAALHLSMLAIGIQPGDEVIVPPITFAATSNAVLYCGGKPVFVDVNPDTLLIDLEKIESQITKHTKAIIAVDYAGQPCDWNALQALAKKYNLYLIADSCHAIGAEYAGKKVGTLADITVFSFHPVKHITTGEGGMCVTDNENLSLKLRELRSHGIPTDARQRETTGAWFYEMTDLGYNYRITDLQCALGISQLKKLPDWLEVRNNLASLYDQCFKSTNVLPLIKNANVLHSYHLYVVRLADRDKIFRKLRENNIGANVHYTPVYLHPYYQALGYKKGSCPVAEKVYAEILTLPLWVGMNEADSVNISKLCGEQDCGI